MSLKYFWCVACPKGTRVPTVPSSSVGVLVGSRGVLLHFQPGLTLPRGLPGPFGRQLGPGAALRYPRRGGGFFPSKVFFLTFCELTLTFGHFHIWEILSCSSAVCYQWIFFSYISVFPLISHLLDIEALVRTKVWKGRFGPKISQNLSLSVAAYLQCVTAFDEVWLEIATLCRSRLPSCHSRAGPQKSAMESEGRFSSCLMSKAR